MYEITHRERNRNGGGVCFYIALLCEISDIYGLQQLITEPTRITESSSSLINVIFTNCINRVVCSRVLHIGICDHSLISVCHKLC